MEVFGEEILNCFYRTLSTEAETDIKVFKKIESDRWFQNFSKIQFSLVFEVEELTISVSTFSFDLRSDDDDFFIMPREEEIKQFCAERGHLEEFVIEESNYFKLISKLEKNIEISSDINIFKYLAIVVEPR